MARKPWIRDQGRLTKVARRSELQRHFETADAPGRQALRGRLLREMGPVQRAEVLRGAHLGPDGWREFCRDVLQARPQVKVHELVALADAAALDLSVAPEDAQDRGQDDETYWGSGGTTDAAWEEGLDEEVAAGALSDATRGAMVRLRLADQNRVAALLELADRGSRELDRPFRELFEEGPAIAQALVATALARGQRGQARLVRLARKAPLLALASIHIGVAAVAGEEAFVAEALKALWGRLRALRPRDRAGREDWLALAVEVLPAWAAAKECLLDLGRGSSDPARAVAYDYLREPQARQADLLEGALAGWTMLVLVMGDVEGLAGIRVHDEALQWARQWPRRYAAADEHLRDCVWGTILTADYVQTPEQLAELVVALHWVAGERSPSDAEDRVDAALTLLRRTLAPLIAARRALRREAAAPRGGRAAAGGPQHAPNPTGDDWSSPLTAEQVLKIASAMEVEWVAAESGAPPALPFAPDWLWDVYIDLVEVCTSALPGRATFYACTALAAALPVRIHGRLLNAVLDLGPAAIETLRDTLRASPSRALIVALDWLGAEGIEDDLVPLLENPDALIRREAIILLAQRADRRVVPVARALCAAEAPAERALGLFAFYHLTVDEGLAPALAALDDPHPAVRSMAFSVLLRTALPQRAAALREAIAGPPGLQAEGALTVACSLGGEEGAAALPEPSQVRGDLAARLPRLRKRLLKDEPLDPDDLPAFRRPPSHPGLLPPHWQAYWADAQRDPIALRWHDRLCNTNPPLSDEDWFEARERFVDHPTLHWLLRDLSADAESQVRLTVAAYLWSDPTTAPEDLWLKAWRSVSPTFLRDKWWRGRGDRLPEEPTSPHTLLAVSTVYGHLLLEHWSGGRLVQELLIGEDAYLMAHWQRLTHFTDAYWGLAVGPTIPAPRLAQFVADHWRRLQDARTSQGATARQILDYLCLQCTLHPGLVQWRDACREALWEALGPMRRGLWGKYQRATARLVGRASEAKFEAELRTRFDEALMTYDPFWSGPPEPLLPMGDLRRRSQDSSLPKTQYGRGIPFVHYFRTQLSDLLPSAPVDQAPHHALQQHSTDMPTKRSRAPRFSPADQIVVDDSGAQWVTIRWLARETGLTEDVLRAEERRGFLRFSRKQGMRVLRRTQVDGQNMVVELQARALLRSPKRLSELFKGSRRTIQRHVAESRSGRTATEALQLMADRLGRRASPARRSWPDWDDWDDWLTD